MVLQFLTHAHCANEHYMSIRILQYVEFSVLNFSKCSNVLQYIKREDKAHRQMERRTSDVATAFRRLLRVQLLLTPGLQKRVLVLSLTVNMTERERSCFRNTED